MRLAYAAVFIHICREGAPNIFGVSRSSCCSMQRATTESHGANMPGFNRVQVGRRRRKFFRHMICPTGAESTGIAPSSPPPPFPSSLPLLFPSSYAPFLLPHSYRKRHVTASGTWTWSGEMELEDGGVLSSGEESEGAARLLRRCLRRAARLLRQRLRRRLLRSASGHRRRSGWFPARSRPSRSLRWSSPASSGRVT